MLHDIHDLKGSLNLKNKTHIHSEDTHATVICNIVIGS